MKLVVFDLDGTLYQAQAATVVAVNKALAEFGLPAVTPERVMSLLGEPAVAFFAAMAPGLCAEDRERLAQRVGFHEREEAAGSGRLFEGVVEALEELRGLGFELAVCSNGRPDYVDGILAACGIHGLFAAVQGNATQRTKSENLQQLLQRLGRPISGPSRPARLSIRSPGAPSSRRSRSGSGRAVSSGSTVSTTRGRPNSPAVWPGSTPS